ncbi:MAG TPA: NAD(P)-dependent oxidoreductase [Candidatus Baltobacteraceae bacterium]
MDTAFPGADIHKPLSKLEVSIEASRCLYCYDAPCMDACPSDIDIPGFIWQIADGNLKGSARTILHSNAMGASCARVCPVSELCEGACVYHHDDNPIRIGDLQRYATDHLRQTGEMVFEPGPDTGKKVAIIGGGPAGLATARDLRRYGHAVTIFDAHEDLGGLNTYGIVPFRLSTEVALWEADQVVRMGVTVRANTRVGVDVQMDDLVKDFDAVVIACGMGNVPSLMIEGEERAWDALDFIERAKTGKPLQGELGDHVAVIGAGNTAIDALTCAKRLGVERVTCYYRRGEESMTAYDFEYEFAKQEGIEFRFFTAPVKIDDEGLTVVRTCHPERSGAESRDRQRLVQIPGSEYTEAVDTVISAIGQGRLLDTLEKLGVALDDGVVRVTDDMATTRKGVFAAGDAIYAKGQREAMVVEAAQQGKIAARSIEAYLMPERQLPPPAPLPELVPAGHTHGRKSGKVTAYPVRANPAQRVVGRT